MGRYDLAVVGGGIHGCAIARDAAGRGLSVLLVEQNDLGSATSSNSTKLIHGGLRYLQQFDFRLVRECLSERQLLLRLAPHLVQPIRFVMPHIRRRQYLSVRLGLWLYDLMGAARLQRSRALDLGDDPAGTALKPDLRRAFEFSDCITDDARLVITTAIGAREKGAVIRPHTRCVAARREHDTWQLILQSRQGRESITARALVNAAGPWAGHFAENVLRRSAQVKLRLVKGSHVVVPRLYAHERAYLLQTDDSRFLFAIPFADAFTLIGTTEVDVQGDPGEATVSADEILYLCRSVSRFFRVPVEPSQLRWTFAGIRALIDDGAERPYETTRDYRLDIDGSYGEPPLISVLGGKLTNHRRVAAAVLERLAHWFALGPAWTDREPLPGGDIESFDALILELARAHPYLQATQARRMARAYGRRTLRWLDGAERLEDLGPRMVGDLHAAELDYLCREEWAQSVDDVLWRRTKLGLTARAAEISNLETRLRSGLAAAS